MSDLTLIQCTLIAITFIWSGFVRSGLGFGGAVLSLPFLLLIHNDALIYLPVISLQLLFFSGLILLQNHRARKQRIKVGISQEDSIDWAYLKKSFTYYAHPKVNWRIWANHFARDRNGAHYIHHCVSLCGYVYFK